MGRFVNELIDYLERQKIIKNVLVISSSKKRYDDNFLEFIYNSKYKRNDYINDIEDFLDYFKKHFPNDYKNSKEYMDFNQNYIENKPSCAFEDAALEELAYCKILLLLFVTQGCVEIELNEKEKENSNLCYRGHSNCNYNLLPSIYRGLNFNGIVDYDKLNEMYVKSQLLKKYSRHIRTVESIDYEFLSFIQHAISYSPLLDFSQDRNIAMVFATSPEGKNYNTYSQTDAELYTLYLKDADNKELDYDVLLKDYCIQYYSNKLKKLSTIFGKALPECSIEDFSVDLRGFIKPTNDRMIYQKGIFLFLKKAVFVNGTLFFPYSLGYIAKSKIPCEKNAKNGRLSKEKIYNEIIKNDSSIDLEHLLNPYQAFAEYTSE